MNLTLVVRRVSSRTRSLNRASAFGEITRWGVGPAVKLKARKARADGRSTALLLAAFTVSFSRRARKLVTLAMTRSPVPLPPGPHVGVAVVGVADEAVAPRFSSSLSPSRNASIAAGLP